MSLPSNRLNGVSAGAKQAPALHSLKIVFLDESYAEPVCALEARCYRSPWSPDLIRGEFGNPVSYRRGIVEGNEVAAYSFSHFIVPELHVLNLAVAPEFRGRGLGKMLLSYLLLSARRTGARSAFLEVRESNLIARRLYASLGFRMLGTRKHYYQDNGEDALILERSLSEPDLHTLRRFIPSYIITG